MKYYYLLLGLSLLNIHDSNAQAKTGCYMGNITSQFRSDNLDGYPKFEMKLCFLDSTLGFYQDFLTTEDNQLYHSQRLNTLESFLMQINNLPNLSNQVFIYNSDKNNISFKSDIHQFSGVIGKEQIEMTITPIGASKSSKITFSYIPNEWINQWIKSNPKEVDRIKSMIPNPTTPSVK